MQPLSTDITHTCIVEINSKVLLQVNKTKKLSKKKKKRTVHIKTPKMLDTNAGELLQTALYFIIIITAPAHGCLY